MADQESYNPPALTTLTLTDRERRVIFRSLEITAQIMDALGNRDETGEALVLADRVCPEGVS